LLSGGRSLRWHGSVLSLLRNPSLSAPEMIVVRRLWVVRLLLLLLLLLSRIEAIATAHAFIVHLMVVRLEATLILLRLHEGHRWRLVHAATVLLCLELLIAMVVLVQGRIELLLIPLLLLWVEAHILRRVEWRVHHLLHEAVVLGLVRRSWHLLILLE